MNELLTQPNPQVQAAHEAIAAAHQLAKSTGVPFEVLSGSTNDDIEKHSIKREDTYADGVTFTAPDAIISVKDDGLDTSKATSAEQTGIYKGASVSDTGRLDRDGQKIGPREYEINSDGVTVERPDGNGSTYTGKIKGVGAERATEIISKRAAQKIGRVAALRAVSLGTEYLEPTN